MGIQFYLTICIVTRIMVYEINKYLLCDIKYINIQTILFQQNRRKNIRTQYFRFYSNY